MATWLKQSTTVTVRLGPFLDKTDGVTEETGASPTVEVSKNHAAFGARSSATAIAHDANGWFSVELNTTDTGTCGPLILKSDSAADWLPVWREFLVVPAAVYDSIVGGTDTLPVDVIQWNGTNVATPDTAGYPKVTAKAGTGTGELSLASGVIAADAVKISGDQTAADNLEAAADGTGFNLGGGAVVAASVTAEVSANVTKISGDGAAADNLEAQFDGTGLVGANYPATQKKADAIIDVVESQRGGHTHAGLILYVDGTGGNDTTGDGSRALPFATITKALTLCSSNAHDLIILLPRAGQSPNVITETSGVTINKNYTFIRGPGRDVKVTRVGAGAVVTITASGVELSGMQIATAGAASNAVQVTSADFARLFRVWIDSASQDAVNVAVGTNCLIERCTITSSGRDGVRVESGAGSGSYTRVVDSVIRDSVGSAINLQGVDASESQIQRNIIRDNAVGITISSGVVDTVITDNRMVNNTSPISDSGTRTLQMWNSLLTDISGNISGTLSIPGGTSLAPAASATLTTGTQAAGTYASTVALDGTYHQINDAGNALEIYYEFNIGASGVPALVKHTGYLTGSNDTLGVYAYDWGNTAWVQIGSLVGQAAAPSVVRTYDLLNTYVGTGGNLGKVRIRFYAASGLTTAALFTDQLLLGYSQVLSDVASQTALNTLTGYVDTEVGAIKAKTDNLPPDPADASDIAAVLASLPDDVWAALSTAAANKIADHVLRRLGSNVEVSADGDTPGLLSLYGLFLAVLNASASASLLTVKHPSGSTLDTADLTRDANASPITAVDA